MTEKVACCASTIALYSLSSLGVLACLYKLWRYVRVKRMLTTYFQDKIVLITGASSGLGKALAEELYPLGARLLLCARNKDELAKVKAQLMKKPGKEPEIVQMDVSAPLETVKPKIDELIGKFQRVDILVNNAGISYRGESMLTKDATFRQIMEVNFFGAIRLTNLVLEHMIAENARSDAAARPRRQCTIVNVGSVQSYIAIPYRSAYTASKHAFIAYSDSLRAELYAHKNINVLTVQPGYVRTNVSINALTSSGEKNNVMEEDTRNGYDPNDVARMMIRSVVSGDREVLIAVLLHRLAIWLRFFSPAAFNLAMNMRARKGCHTGAKKTN